MNMDQLPALDFEAGLPRQSSDDPTTSVGDVVIGIVTGVIAGLAGNEAPTG